MLLIQSLCMYVYRSKWRKFERRNSGKPPEWRKTCSEEKSNSAVLVLNGVDDFVGLFIGGCARLFPT